ncbi:hypothetical protein OL229_16205 [Neisseriaceae bacterium JH1-16]|nr:hypothetical protein [Neisseriaceae bacterium JH1-16]
MNSHSMKGSWRQLKSDVRIVWVHLVDEAFDVIAHKGAKEDGQETGDTTTTTEAEQQIRLFEARNRDLSGKDAT